MKFSVLFLSFVSFFGILNAAEDECPKDQKVVACYFSSWAVYREDLGAFGIDDIDPEMCTHLIYAFAGLSIYGGIESFDPTYDINNGGFKAFVALKEANPCLKTLLAIGGWNQGSRPYSVMVSNEEYRTAFIESVLRLVAVYGFDGLDFDWEYPTERGGIPDDKKHFGELLIELKDKFKPWDLMVTIAVPTSVAIAEAAYDVVAIKSHVDYVFIMGYDVTPTNSNTTGLLSPRSEIEKVVTFWSDNVGKEKVVLGVPAYGRSFTLEDPESHDLGAPTAGPGEAGTYTKEAGFLSYYEVLFAVRRDYAIVPVEGEANTYAYYEDQWIAYESPEDLEEKVNYALEEDIAGMMIWSIDTDDFGGYTDEVLFPIVNTIKNMLHKSK